MQLGFAAGVAADLAVVRGTDVRLVLIGALQISLLEREQREDVAWDHPARQAAEYLGTKGFFTDYAAGLDDPIP